MHFIFSPHMGMRSCVVINLVPAAGCATRGYTAITLFLYGLLENHGRQSIAMIKSYKCIVSVLKGDDNSTRYTCASARAGARGAPSAAVAGAMSVHGRPAGRHVDAAVACGSAKRGNPVRTQEHIYWVRAGWREDAPHAVTRAGRARGPQQAGGMPHASRCRQSVAKAGGNATGVSLCAGILFGGWGNARTPRYKAGVVKRSAFRCGVGHRSSNGGCSPPKTFSKTTCDLVMQPLLMLCAPDG